MDTKSDGDKLTALCAEVKQNGFSKDLVTKDGESLQKGNYAIVVVPFVTKSIRNLHDWCSVVVDRKLKHPKNQRRGDKLHIASRAEMLALVLYTGCDCTYALCKAERSGDYGKWKVK